MKVGDIIICLNNISKKTLLDYDIPTDGLPHDSLITGNQYKVLDTGINKDIGSIPWVLVQCEDGSKQHFSTKRFITLREYNLEKLSI